MIFNKKILGYVAMAPDRSYVLCDGDACIVASSEEKMKEYIKDRGDPDWSYDIEKAYAKDVLFAIDLGGEYQFDKESYDKYKKVASDLDILIADINPIKSNDKNRPIFYNVKMVIPKANIKKSPKPGELGSKERPCVIRAQNEERLKSIIEICDQHNLIVIGGVEPDKKEDISDAKRALTETITDDEPLIVNKIGRNEPCPCNSKLKHKKCCLGKI